MSARTSILGTLEQLKGPFKQPGDHGWERVSFTRYLARCRAALIVEEEREPGAFKRFQARCREVGDMKAYDELYARKENRK